MSLSDADAVLAFDVGSRWVGVAIGNALTRAPRSLCTLDREQADVWTRLDALLSEWRPAALVVGEPLQPDGSEQESTRIARRFARQLAARCRAPVVLVDEAHSSREAQRRFADARRRGDARRRDAGNIDAAAAAVILQRWFDAGMPLDSTSSSDHD